MKINIGCGRDRKEGYKNIDISEDVGADECYDITKGIKEDDDSLDEIFAGCVLEQVDDLVYVMNECWRTLKKGGELVGYVPSTDPKVIFLDPMDKRFFQRESFEYFDKTKNAWQQFGRNYGLKGWTSSKTEMAYNGIIHFQLIK